MPVRHRKARLAGAALIAIGGMIAGPIAGLAHPWAGAQLHPPGSAKYTSLPVQGLNDADVTSAAISAKSVKLWSSSILSLGRTYKYSMVGNSPLVKETAPSTTVPVDVIPIRMTFADSGDVLDPTAVNAPCGVTTSPDARTLASPIFANHSYSVGGNNLGNVQYEDAFTRANFAKQVLGAGAINPNYGIVLSAVNHAVLGVNVGTNAGFTDPTSNTGACAPIGLVDLQSWDTFVKSTLIPQLVTAKQTNPTHMVVLLTTNVVNFIGTSNNCCVLGYHSGYKPSATSGTQYYATADYDTTGVFNSNSSVVDDVGPLSHELGEWIDDPNGNNATPAWGHIGQVSGCQSNLEVGDPLSGTVLPVTMPNGLTYHPQELAFFSWFYRQSPSLGVNGLFSSNGTFTSGAGPVCA